MDDLEVALNPKLLARLTVERYEHLEHHEQLAKFRAERQKRLVERQKSSRNYRTIYAADEIPF